MLDHSSRSVTIGSMLASRRAGTADASNAARLSFEVCFSPIPLQSANRQQHQGQRYTSKNGHMSDG